VFEVDARAPLEELEAALDRDLAPPDMEEDIDTVAGLVVALAGRVPQRGEVIAHPAGFDLEVVEADPRRVRRVRVRPAVDLEPPRRPARSRGRFVNLPALPKLTPWRARGLALARRPGRRPGPSAVRPADRPAGLRRAAVAAGRHRRPPAPALGLLARLAAGPGYFGLGTWWIAEAFMVDAANQGWMAPFAVAAMAGGMALFWGLAAVLYRLIRPPACGGCWCSPGPCGPGMDARPHPDRLSLEPAGRDLAGRLGRLAIRRRGRRLRPDLDHPGHRRRPGVWREGRRGGIAVGAAARLAALYIGGWALPRRPGRRRRPDRAHRPGRYPAGIQVGRRRFAQIVQAYVSLTARPYAGKPADLVVWPEGALPRPSTTTWSPAAGCGRRSSTPCIPANPADRRLSLRGHARQAGLLQQPGRPAPHGRRRRGGRDLRQAPAGAVRRVPAGRRPADPAGRQEHGPPGRRLRHGPSPAAAHRPDLLVQPLICYESLFPRLAEPAPGVRAIVNVSNDAWFGVTSGPLQHLNLASYRAIESGLPIIRATPTGVSA
jgi:apolipoprotein N-acyltransferase